MAVSGAHVWQMPFRQIPTKSVMSIWIHQNDAGILCQIYKESYEIY